MTTKKILLTLGAVVIVLALLAAIFVGAIVGFAIYQVGNSEAAAKAKDFLRNSEKLKGDIGEIKDFGSIITGNVRIFNNNGEATLHLKVIGERQTVNASVDLVYTNGSAWRVSYASYVNSSGQTVDLLDPYEAFQKVFKSCPRPWRKENISRAKAQRRKENSYECGSALRLGVFARNSFSAKATFCKDPYDSKIPVPLLIA